MEEAEEEVVEVMLEAFGIVVIVEEEIAVVVVGEVMGEVEVEAVVVNDEVNELYPCTIR